MLTRRQVLAAPLLGLAAAAPDDRFQAFLSSVAAQARSSGIGAATVAAALSGISPSARVLQLSARQPEFTETWARYLGTHVTQARVARGRAIYAADRSLLDAMRTQYGVGPAAIMGIWGLETDYGAYDGGFPTVQTLATLACFGDRPEFFRAELLASLRILDHADIGLAAMLGSYAGAMGQPQFMPSAFLRYAVDFDGDGRRDIWSDRSDVLASIANYLAANGWRPRQPACIQVLAPADLPDPDQDAPRAFSAWHRAGVRVGPSPMEAAAASADLQARLLRPDGAEGDAFLVFTNFEVLRAYNPSNLYALSVAVLGDRVIQ